MRCPECGTENKKNACQCPECYELLGSQNVKDSMMVADGIMGAAIGFVKGVLLIIAAIVLYGLFTLAAPGLGLNFAAMEDERRFEKEVISLKDVPVLVTFCDTPDGDRLDRWVLEAGGRMRVYAFRPDPEGKYRNYRSRPEVVFLNGKEAAANTVWTGNRQLNEIVRFLAYRPYLYPDYAPGRGGGVTEVFGYNFDRTVLRGRRPVFVNFTAFRNGRPVGLAGDFAAMARQYGRYADFYAAEYSFYYEQRFGLKSSPTVICFRNGAEAGRFSAVSPVPVVNRARLLRFIYPAVLADAKASVKRAGRKGERI